MFSGGAGRAILAHRGFGNFRLSLGGEYLGQFVPIPCPAPQIAVRSGAAVYGGSGVSEPPLNCEAPRGTVRGDPGPRYAGGFESRFSMILMVASFICVDGKCLLVFLAQLLSFGQSEGWTLGMDRSRIPAKAQPCRPRSCVTR